MKILVTGASGFIGSHLASHLASEGNEVLGVDNYSNYYSPELKFQRKKFLLEPFGVRCIDLDLTNFKKTQKLVDTFKPDRVFHLAAQAGVRIPLRQPENYISSNLVGHANIQIACFNAQIPDFLYASSSSVYGAKSRIPFKESESEVFPTSFYGTTKLVDEIISGAITRNSLSRSRGLRFFTVYGPWGRPDMAYFQIISAGILGNKFKLFGDGQVLRDFTYITDIVNGICLLADNLSSQNPGFSDVVNIGGGKPESILSLFNSICEILGKRIETQILDSNKLDLPVTQASYSYLESLTGFVPQIHLKHGLSQVINWALHDIRHDQLERWASFNI